MPYDCTNQEQNTNFSASMIYIITSKTRTKTRQAYSNAHTQKNKFRFICIKSYQFFFENILVFTQKLVQLYVVKRSYAGGLMCYKFHIFNHNSNSMQCYCNNLNLHWNMGGSVSTRARLWQNNLQTAVSFLAASINFIFPTLSGPALRPT